MKRLVLFLLGLSLIVGLGIGVFWSTNENVAKAEGVPHPLDGINQKARDARNGNQANAEALVGEVIRVAGFENELIGFTSSSIKQRVGRAESRFRLGQSAGIPERKIVRTINGLARQFNLPAYAKTDLYEVRKLRLELLPNFPDLIGQKTQNVQPMAVGAGLEAEMSPAESVLILSLMIQQKLLNQDYQLTTAERRTRWNEMHNHRPGRISSPHPARNRASEMRERLRVAASSASMSDAFQLSTITLNTLGIEQ